MKPRQQNNEPDRIKYAGLSLDRASLLRADPDWVARAWQQPGTRLVAVWRNCSLLRMGGNERAEAVCLDVTPSIAFDDAVFLGLDDEIALFAIDLSDQDDPAIAAAPEASFVDLRRYGPLLDDRDAGLLAYARAMLNWHRNHQHCGRCGAPTVSDSGGHRRRCTDAECGQTSFPRTDPAIIVLVEHPGDDGGPPRCLLGRSARFPAGVYSTLAGFVEPGESLEQTVRREVFEEAGVQVGAVHYLASQPWPFPGSLMLGFHARATSNSIVRHDKELEDARWFSVDELDQAGEWGEAASLCLPRRDSIARFLIDHWRREKRGR
ncbi:MAG: NAD(+) diphosphatase [Wenzhouxiangella sp.]|nr:MAG: NAD(+) diphosphatase [Wenzhouxiangella sp.]